MFLSLFCLQYGEVIQTVNETEEQEFFTLPASAGTAHCLDANPAGKTELILKKMLVRHVQTVAATMLVELFTRFNSTNKLHGLR